MDNRNVFVAIALSMAVLLFWGAFFETPRQVKENQKFDNVQTDQNKAVAIITEGAIFQAYLSKQSQTVEMEKR